MYSARYEVTLKGETGLLPHRDNITFGEKVKAWQKNPANKSLTRPGDDRTPAWTWLGYTYDDGVHMTIDADNIMTMLRDGGQKCPAPKGKGSLKAATQSGIIVNEIGWPIVGSKGIVPMKEISALSEESDFTRHEAVAKRLGFELFVKRVRIGAQKHIRVRPLFMPWSVVGTITVLDETLTKDVLHNLLTMAGRFSGLCDYRPGSPKSGRFGCFTVSLKTL